MNKVKKFINESLGSVRTIKIRGIAWFFAVDVCSILGLEQVTRALSRLDNDERMTLTLSKGHSGKRGGAQSVNLINEYGLWTLVMASKKPNAKDFKRWLTHEVIPSIHKNGGYISGQEKLDKEKRKILEEEIKKLSEVIDNLTEINESLKNENEELISEISDLMYSRDEDAYISTNDGGYVTETEYEKYYA